MTERADQELSISCATTYVLRITDGVDDVVRVIRRTLSGTDSTTHLTSSQILSALAEDDIMASERKLEKCFVLSNDTYSELTSDTQKSFALLPGPVVNVFDVRIRRDASASNIGPRRVTLFLTMQVSTLHNFELSLAGFPPGCHVRYFDEEFSGFIRVDRLTGHVPSTGPRGGDVQLLLEFVASGGSVLSVESPPQSDTAPPTSAAVANMFSISPLPYFASTFTAYIDRDALASVNVEEGIEDREKEREEIWAPLCPPPTDKSHYQKSPWKEHVRNGIPAHIREIVWCTLTHAALTLSQRPTFFTSAVERTFKWERLLEKYPEFSPKAVPTFGGAATGCGLLSQEGLLKMRVILCLIAEHYPEVVYSPTIPSIVALMLMQCKEALTTAAIFHLIQTSKVPGSMNYHLRLTFDSYVTQLRVFEFLLRKRSPSLAKFFLGKQISPCEFAHKVFAAMFTNVFPLYHAMQIFDGFLNEGAKVLHRFSTSLLMHYEPFVVSCRDVDEMIAVLRSLCAAGSVADMDTIRKAAYGWWVTRKEIEDAEKSIALEPQQKTPSYVPLRISTQLVVRYRPKVHGGSLIVNTPALWEDLFVWLPSEKIVGAEIFQLYSTETQGWSLQTLYQRCTVVGDSCPVLLLLDVLPKDSKRESISLSGTLNGTIGNLGSFTTRRHVIGAYLSHAPVPQAKRTTDHSSSPSRGEHFYGNTDCFVFSLLENKRYKASDTNHNFILPKGDELLVGCGGEGSAISLPADFHIGTSNRCDTFGNERLVPSAEQFHVLHVEVFGLGDKPNQGGVFFV